jgi:predicted nucleotide-binding protein
VNPAPLLWRDPDIERPSDFDGVVYISLDDADWRVKLGRELQAAGYKINWNEVMR